LTLFMTVFGLSMPFSDETLVTESLSGSHAAFEKLMLRYEGLVYWIAFSWSKNRESSLDICQEIFIKVFRKLGSFNATGSFKSWLSRIASREAATWIRRHKKYLDDIAIEDECEPSTMPTQEKELLKQESIKQLMTEFQSLNTRQRLAISLRYFEKMPIYDISLALDCSEGVAKNILFRSVQKLRENLKSTRERIS